MACTKVRKVDTENERKSFILFSFTHGAGLEVIVSAIGLILFMITVIDNCLFAKCKNMLFEN